MKSMITMIFILGSFFCYGAKPKSKLIDVGKSSKISDYFKKINTKVTDDSESEPLVKAEKVDKQASELLREEDILLAEATREEQSSPPMSSENKMIFAVFALMLVAAVFFISIQKFGKNKGHSTIAKNIKILTQKSIGPKKNLMLIRVAGETLLLGVTDQNINHLKTLSLLEDELPSYTEPQFSNQLKEKIEQTKEGSSLVDQTSEDLDGFAISRIDDVKQAVSRYSI